MFICFTAGEVFAQTTVFNYQGKLTDSGAAQSNYQMQFKLYDQLTGGTQIGATIPDVFVTVNQGVFKVSLDFGASVFTGADRFLEIGVRRAAGDPYTILTPREQIASSPYSIRTLSAAQADVALDSNKLGGVDASQYVTTTSVGSSFIKNATTPQQTANFNISGNGTLGGTLQAGQVNAQTLSGGLGLAQTDGAVTVGTKISLITPSQKAGFIGTTSNHPLAFFAGNSGATMTLDQLGNLTLPRSFLAGQVNASTITAQTTTGNFGLIHTDGTATVASYVGVTSSGAFTLGGWLGTQSNHPLYFFANGGQPKMTLNTAGNVGIGTIFPLTRLDVRGGTPWTSNQWTGSLSLGNASAIGWDANASGQQFGIGQSTGGLYFFRTKSAFTNTLAPANYNLEITDNGNLVQPPSNNGLVKASALIRRTLSGCFGTSCNSITYTIMTCYSSVANSTSVPCGFSVSNGFQGQVDLDFGFLVTNRFISLTPGVGQTSATVANFPTSNRITIALGNAFSNGTSDFYIFVF